MTSQETIGNYKIIQFINSGASGRVYFGEDIHNKNVAIKRIKITDKCSTSSINREISCLKTLSNSRHPNVLYYRDTFEDPYGDYIYIITDYYKDQNLISFETEVDEKYNVSTYYDIMLNCLINLIHGLHFIHNHGIIHADIKPDNIEVISDQQVSNREGSTYVTNIYRPVFLDFGFSSFSNDIKGCKKFRGTPKYVAPELYKQHFDSDMHTGVNDKSDVWALGLSFYYITNTSMWPSYIVDVPELGRYVMSGKKDLVVNSTNFKFDQLLYHMLNYDPDLRYNTQELLDLLEKND
jgi:NIMA (never in mitosis gene a)-related kinase